jgi:hypothetical protein
VSVVTHSILYITANIAMIITENNMAGIIFNVLASLLYVYVR